LNLTTGNDSEIAKLRERLNELDEERVSVLDRLGVLKNQPKRSDGNVVEAGRIAANSPSAEKIHSFKACSLASRTSTRSDVSVLARMASKRQTGYHSLGYSVKPLIRAKDPFPP
jgi:hypothetical protein